MTCKILLWGALLVASSSALSIVNHQKSAALVAVESKVGKPKYTAWWTAWNGAKANGVHPMITKTVWQAMTPGGTFQGRGKGTTGSTITEIDPLLDQFNAASTPEARLTKLQAIKEKYDGAIGKTVTKYRQEAFEKLRHIVERRIKDEEVLVQINTNKAAATGKEVLLIGDVEDMTIKLQYNGEIRAITQALDDEKTFGEYPSSTYFGYPLGKAGWDTYVANTLVTHISAHGGVYKPSTGDEGLKNAIADKWKEDGDVAFHTVVWLAASKKGEDDWMITPSVVAELSSVPSKLLYLNTCLAGFTKELACAFVAKGTPYVIAFSRTIQGERAYAKAGAFYAEWRTNGWSDAELVKAFDSKLYAFESNAGRLFTAADNEHQSTHADEDWQC